MCVCLFSKIWKKNPSPPSITPLLPQCGQPHIISAPCAEALGPGIQLSESPRGANTKVTPPPPAPPPSKHTHTHTPSHIHEYPIPHPQNNNPRCPSCQSKTPSGTCMRVWISGISIQCHAPWNPVRGPLEYISIALSFRITTLLFPFNIRESSPNQTIIHVSTQPYQSKAWVIYSNHFCKFWRCVHLLPPVVAFQNDTTISFRLKTISVLFEATCGCPSRKIPEMFYQHASCKQEWNVCIKQPYTDTGIVEINKIIFVTLFVAVLQGII